MSKFHALENQSSSLFHIIPFHVGSFWGGVSPVRNGAFSRMFEKHVPGLCRCPWDQNSTPQGHGGNQLGRGQAMLAMLAMEVPILS